MTKLTATFSMRLLLKKNNVTSLQSVIYIFFHNAEKEPIIFLRIFNILLLQGKCRKVFDF